MEFKGIFPNFAIRKPIQPRLLMKPYHSIIVFLILVLSAGLTSLDSYNAAKVSIIDDMNRALELTMESQQDRWITPDTIINYRNNLKIEALKDESFVSYAQNTTPKALCSEKIEWKGNGSQSVAFQGVSTCSFATIWGLSDQKLSSFLLLLALVWLSASYFFVKKNHRGKAVFGGLIYNEETCVFCDLNNSPISLTPMQTELMRLFFKKSNYSVSKQEICECLWPKKPDASETLYTLIRRIKPILEERGKVSIVNERGKEYRLERR